VTVNLRELFSSETHLYKTVLGVVMQILPTSTLTITYFNPHFRISEMPTISMGKLYNYSFVKEHCGASALLQVWQKDMK